jgi:hypothetical protein
MNLCLCDSEERERGVGSVVNVTILFSTLQVVCVYYKSMKRELQVLLVSCLLFIMKRENQS